MAKSIISKKMEGFDKLKEILAKNLGYIGKFTEYLMNENIPVQDLEVLYKDLLDLKTKQKNLDITNLKYEECSNNSNNLLINDDFPTPVNPHKLITVGLILFLGKTHHGSIILIISSIILLIPTNSFFN